MLTLVIIVILFFMGIVIPKNSKISIFGWCYLGWLSVTAPTDYLTSDYYAYSAAYSDPISYQDVFERGYTEFERLSYHFGLSFDQFRSIFVGITIFILFLGVRRFTKNYALFLSLYLLTFFSQDLIQMRSQFMMAVLVLGYSLLIGKKHNKIRLVSAICVIIIGSQIHSSGYIFMIGICLYFSSKYIDIIVKFSLFSTVIFSFVISVIFRSSLFVAMVNLLGRLTGRDEVLSDKLFVLFTNGTDFSLKLWYFIPLLISWIAMLCIIRSSGIRNLDAVDSIKYRVLLSGVLMGFIGFALLSIAPDYSRIFRHGMTFFIILIAFYFENARKMSYRTGSFVMLGFALLPFAYFSFHSTSITWGPTAEQSPSYLLKIIRPK